MESEHETGDIKEMYFCTSLAMASYGKQLELDITNWNNLKVTFQREQHLLYFC